MVTCKGERETGAVSGRLPDNLGELACTNRKIACKIELIYLMNLFVLQVFKRNNVNFLNCNC